VSKRKQILSPDTVSLFTSAVAATRPKEYDLFGKNAVPGKFKYYCAFLTCICLRSKLFFL
jgi:hypothetical protein